MKKARAQRPVNLDLSKFHFPVPAIVSILHRISGVILFLLIPFILWVLHTSLGSEEQFASIHDWLQNPLAKLVMWVCLSACAYHIFAGIRHMVGDVGYGDSLKATRISAFAVIILSIVSTVLIGVWLW